MAATLSRTSHVHTELCTRVCSALKPTNRPLANQLTTNERADKKAPPFYIRYHSLGSTFTLAKQIINFLKKIFWILKLLFFHDLPSSSSGFFLGAKYFQNEINNNNNNQGIFCHQNVKIKIKREYFNFASFFWNKIAKFVIEFFFWLHLDFDFSLITF